MKFKIVAIEREYASGGKEIGQIVAKHLGVACYNKEILELAAQRKGIASDYIEHLEETATNSLLYSLNALGKIPWGESGITLTDEVAILEAEVIKEITNRENCVIIGRCAGSVLSERDDVLNVFVKSNFETRKKRAVSEYGIDPNLASDTIKKYDKRRANFYNTYANRNWKDFDSYDVIIDSGKLGMEKSAAAIIACMK